MKTTTKEIVFLAFLFLSNRSLAQLTEHTIDSDSMPNEPTVAIASDSVLYAASNVNRFYTLNQVNEKKYSEYDLKVGKRTATSIYGVYGDPVLHYAGDTLFFAHLAKAQRKEYGEWFDRIVLQKISDPKVWKEQSYSIGYNEGKMQDKPWLSSTSNGDILVTWTEFDKYGSARSEDRSRIRFSKYESDINKATEAITLSDTTGDCLDGDNTLEGATTAVGRGGKIYAVWSGYANVYFDYSDDGGITWNRDKVIANQPGGWEMDMPNIMRANGMPFITCDTLRNRIFVSWSDVRSGNADIWMKYSDDEGSTWSSIVQLNLDNTKTHQYFPNMVLDENTGNVYVAYYDFKSSPSNTFYTISLAQVDTVGRVSNFQLTPYVSALPGSSVFFGDYLDIDIKDSLLAVVYTTYDIAQKTLVKLVQERTLQNGIFFRIAVSNTVAVVRNVDETSLRLNIEHPYKLKFKIEWKDAETGKIKKYKCRTKDKMVKRGVDEVFGTIDYTKEDQLVRLSYKFKDLETNDSYSRLVIYNADSQ